MKKLLLILGLLFGVPSSFSQSAVCVLESSAAMLLHPKMRNFYFSLRRFRKDMPSEEGHSPSEWEAQLKIRLQELNQTLRQLEVRKPALIRDLNKKLIEVQKVTPPEQLIPVQNQMIAKLEADQNQAKTEAIQMLSQWFLNERETIQTFFQMYQEIQELAEEQCLKTKHSFLLITDILKTEPPLIQEHRLNDKEASEFTLMGHFTTLSFPSQVQALKDRYLVTQNQLLNLSQFLFPLPYQSLKITDVTASILQILWSKIPSELDLPRTALLLYQSLVRQRQGLWNQYLGDEGVSK